MTSRRIGIVVTLALTFSTAAGFAQTTRATPPPPTTTSTPTPSAHPNLAALDAECQQLFQQAESRIVRVHVPVPVPVDEFLAQFDPQVRAQLKPNAPRLFVQTSSTTQAVQVSPESNLIPLPSVNATLNVEFAGLVLNRNGDVLLPLFIDPAYVPLAADRERGRPAGDDGAGSSGRTGRRR